MIRCFENLTGEEKMKFFGHLRQKTKSHAAIFKNRQLQKVVLHVANGRGNYVA